jgi:hypothetical protein
LPNLLDFGVLLRSVTIILPTLLELGKSLPKGNQGIKKSKLYGPTRLPETAPFFDKDRCEAKKQVTRRKLFRKIKFLNFQQYFQLST